MKKQAFPIGQKVLGLSLGLGGVLNILCVSALADPVLQEAQDAEMAIENDDRKDSDRLKIASLSKLTASSHKTLVQSSKHAFAVEDDHSPTFAPLPCGVNDFDSCDDAISTEPAVAPEPSALMESIEVEHLEIEGLKEASLEIVEPLEIEGLEVEVAEVEPLGIELNEPQTVAQVPDFGDLLPEERIRPLTPQPEGTQDDELGNLRLQLQRSRTNEDLGILRLIQTAQAAPPPPKPPIAFLSGRLGFLDSDNIFRSNRTDAPSQFGDDGFLRRLNDQVYQSGLTVLLFPKLSDSTNLYAIAGTTLARYERFDGINTNQVELQLGVRQRLAPRTFAQLGWRNQRFYTPGYREKKLGINYIDAQVSHRSILGSKTWLDSFYQARLGFARASGDNPNIDRDRASRFRQTLTLSLNHKVTRDLSTSLLYQIDFDDYIRISRFDTYQQVLGVISYSLTPESKVSLFGGTRFGRSSNSAFNLDDTFYGAGLNVNIPLF